MTQTSDAACFRGNGQRNPPYTFVGRRRLGIRRYLTSLHTPAPLRWRERTPGADFQQTPSVRVAVENRQAKLRVVAGIALALALLAVGTTAAGAAKVTEQRLKMERLTDSRSGSAPNVAPVVGSSRSQTLRPHLSSSTSEVEQVDLFGDSLGYQAAPYLDMFFAQNHGYTVSNHTYGGTATCDWLSRMASAANERPQAALLVFSGNALTPCMGGVTPGSPQYYDLYRTYTKRAIGIFSAEDVHVFLVGTPVDEFSMPGWDQLDDIYRQLADANPLTVTFVDAGASVETAAGGFTWALPCIRIEPRCGQDGTNVVRSPDGIHFCPDGTPATLGVTGPCEEYSSGAFRFALAMMNAVTQYAYSTPRDE
jgi:hypothetical protein